MIESSPRRLCHTGAHKMADDGNSQELPYREWRNNSFQYEMLLRCSEKRDITEWNSWREKNPSSEIWLEGVDLAGAFLQKADFRGARMSGVCLDEADLTRARFNDNAMLKDTADGGSPGKRPASLDRSSLKRAKLASACLEDVDLTASDLADADLSSGRMKWAVMDMANLSSARLQYCNLRNSRLIGASFDDAKMSFVRLRNANLSCARLRRADVRKAELEAARLDGTILDGADISGGRLERAILVGASLRGTSLQLASVDGRTLICNCPANRWTDFEGVGLGNCRIDPGLRQLLESNVRRKRWADCYSEGPIWQRPLRRAAQFFWLMSDYGTSSGRIALAFLAFSAFFAVVYYSCPGLVQLSNGQGLKSYWHALYFSVVTMTTLGFGDIHASPDSWLGQTLLMLQVICGYVLLGALVSRLAILFQTGGPADTPAKGRDVKPIDTHCPEFWDD